MKNNAEDKARKQCAERLYRSRLGKKPSGQFMEVNRLMWGNLDRAYLRGLQLKKNGAPEPSITEYMQTLDMHYTGDPNDDEAFQRHMSLVRMLYDSFTRGYRSEPRL